METAPSRLDLLVEDCIGYFTGLSPVGGPPSVNTPAKAAEIAPTLYVRTNRGGTAICLFAEPEADAKALEARMCSSLRELAEDPALWGYCSIYVFQWPGGLLHGEPPQDGLLIRAGDRAEPLGLALFHPLETDKGGTIIGLKAPLFVKASPSWFTSPNPE